MFALRLLSPSVRLPLTRPSARSISIRPASRASLYFSRKHEWVDVTDGGVGTVGISDYAQAALGDIVYAQLPDPEATLGRGEECGALESVKAASELFSPVSGTVLEKNESVEAAPALINSSPHIDGWLFKVKLSDPTEVKDLLSQDQYDAYLKTQEESES